TDSLNAYNQNIYGPTTFPFDDPNGAPIAATPCCITFGSIFDEKKRDALSGSLEWHPNSVVKNGVVTGIQVNDFQPEMVNNTTDRVVTTSVFGLNVEWKPTDKLKFVADGYRSTANRPEGGADTFVTAGLVSNNNNAPDTLILTDLPNSLPSLNVLVPPSPLGLTACPKGTASSTSPGSCSYTSLMNSGFLNNNNYWSTHYV